MTAIGPQLVAWDLQAGVGLARATGGRCRPLASGSSSGARLEPGEVPSAIALPPVKVHPYEDAPRLPPGDLVDVRLLASGGWTELEIGPGRGWFLVERATVEPTAALVGLEIRRKWAAVVDARLSARGLGPRARVFAEDAAAALPRLGPDGSVRRVFVHFPDPWWKKRHQKRRVDAEAASSPRSTRLLEQPGG